MKEKEILLILGRYIAVAILAFGNLYLFYAVFTPLTVYPSYAILKLINPSAQLMGAATIKILNAEINLVQACIAGAAYYLLLALNLTTPMPVKKRAKSIIFLFSSFLIINIARIVAFSMLFASGYSYFDVAHRIIWYAGSTIFVAAIWFINIKIFKINQIPAFSDIQEIKKEITRKKN